MTALKLGTRLDAFRANDLVVTRQANVVFGTAEQTLASLFPCAARHPYPRDWQSDPNRLPERLIAVGHRIGRSARTLGASSRMSASRKCRPIAGKCFAAT
jgi:hypothetical protein